MEIDWFIWSDGSIFTGTFYYNKIDGRGIYQWNDGRRNEGYWKDNKMNGSILVCKLILFRLINISISIKINWFDKSSSVGLEDTEIIFIRKLLNPPAFPITILEI